jgi:FkbM family methyltransferase
VLEVQPLAQIHCFEPSAKAFQKLVANAFPSNVACNNIGIGSQVEKRTFFVDEGFSELSSFHVGDPERTLTPETVQMETLSGYCHTQGIEWIDFLKIDVEGHELEVLRGAVSLLSNRAIAAIQFEYGSTYIGSRTLLKDVFDLVQNFDYDVYKIMPFTLRSIPRYETYLETFETANYLLRLRNLP